MDMINTDKQAILNNTCTIPTKIKIYNGELLERTLTEEDYVINWNHEDFRYVPNEGFIGQFVERIVDGHLKNVNDSFTLVDKEIEIEYGITTTIDNVEQTNWYSLGRFIVSSTEDDNVKDTMSFKAVDYTKKFEKKYESNLTFPTTAALLAYDCTNQCGVELDTNGEDGIFKTEDVSIDENKRYYIAETEDIYEEHLLSDIDDLSTIADSKLRIDTGSYTSAELLQDLTNYYYTVFWGYTNYPNEYFTVYIDDGSYINTDFDSFYYPNGTPFDKQINDDHKYIYVADHNDNAYILNDLSVPECYGDYIIPSNATNIEMAGQEYIPVSDSVIWNCIKILKKVDENIIGYNYVPEPNVADINKYYETDFGFKNQDFVIDGNPYTNNETCREVMKDIGKLAFSWVRIDENNKCCIDFTKETEVDEYDEINYNMYYDLQTTGTTYGNVTKVIVGMKDIDGENVTIVDPNYIEGAKETELGVWDNPLTYTQQKRSDVINQGSFLFGYNYQEVDLTTIGHPWLTGKERILIKDMEQNDIYTYPFNRTLSYMGHIKTKIQAPATSETNTKYTYDGKISEAVKNTQIIVNKAEGQITSLTSRTDVLENQTKDTYSVEQINELVQTAVSGLTNTFTQSGGNNIFRNTGLWFETNDSNNPYEFWSGLVEKTKETKASNMNGMLLQNGTLEQTQIVANGIYTIAFKYKKLISLSVAKVYINDIEYELTETDDTEFVKTITVTSESIDIKFTCDINNGCEIYDLMGNVGDVGLAYTQNQNETTTDTVNISKGITITSSDTNTTFKAQSDGIRVFNSRDLDNPVTEFVDTGMITDEATIKNKSQIVGTLWQEVDGQTWITRL